jgi:hypothetical protein
MIFRAAPLKLYAIFAFLFVLPVVQAADADTEVGLPVSRYISYFLGHRLNRNETEGRPR